MILADLAHTDAAFGQDLMIPQRYRPTTPRPLTLGHLSPAAQTVIQRLNAVGPGHRLSDDQPEVIALRILDFLTSKKGQIHRKGQSQRSESFYHRLLDLMAPSIRNHQPLILSTLCLCTGWANAELVGSSPYPHMASYLALENIHKIAAGVQELYPPGVSFVLGYEGYLFQPLYFHPDAVVDYTLSILQELNEVAFRVINRQPQAANPVRIVDARWMIAQVYDSFKHFQADVEAYRRTIDVGPLKDWQDWYKTTNAATFFPSTRLKEDYAQRAASWRAAVHHFKYTNGKYGTGFVSFSPEVIPFTTGGRRNDMLALQLVPYNSYLPHQRAITYDRQTGRWNMRAFCDISRSSEAYMPCFVPDYGYPFYYEKRQIG